ncbi:hypothetical protein [Sphingomonas corticis]|uniref:Uncharacterized protein n=1 Tax=Sphingomonas corticis TaxID=2722791 RepID=A0ABX1CPY2_9SPHN|nr:hypothetical protein [Sphingomonas corticis]NJR80007.1 hypothetical protein [Sphingomonas corticis]
MVTNLADALDAETLLRMEASGRRNGTDGDRVRRAYGLKRSNRLNPLRGRLRARLERPDRAAIIELTRGYTMHREAARAVASAGIDPVDVIALAIWARSVDMRINDGMTVTAFADTDTKRLVVSLLLGPEGEALWDFDDRSSDHRSAGSIEIRNHPLPESVLVALSGRPLEAVLTHPVTDGAGLRISSTSIDKSRNATCLELERARGGTARVELVPGKDEAVAPDAR